MHTFFHGWRRKAGIVALVIACVCLVGWIRSFIVTDHLTCRTGQYAVDELFSADGKLGGMSYRIDQENQYRGEMISLTTWWPEWSTYPADKTSLNRFRWLNWGYGIYDFEPNIVKRYRHPVIPYWVIILPLSALSAYLILWKPRKLV